MQNLIIAINCVLPVFLVILTGALIRRTHIVPDETFPTLSKLAFHFLLPCMLFHSSYTADRSSAFDPSLMSFLVVGVLIWFLVGFLFSIRFIPDPRVRGLMVQTFFRSNIGVVGISMAGSMMGDPGVAAMSMAVAVLIPIFNVLAVVTLEFCRGGRMELGPTLLGILKNPLIVGCVLGLLFGMISFPIPAPVLKALDQIGDTGSILTLIALGASFQFSGLRKNLNKVVLATVIRLLLTPAVFLSAAYLLGFRGNSLGLVLLCTSPSLATSAFPMALARDSDYELTGHVVVTTSFFCCFTIFLWILGLGQMGLL